MIKIQDVIVPTKGTAKYLNVVALTFAMNPSSVGFYWQLMSEVEVTEDEVVKFVPGICLLDGNLTMTKEEYDAWGSDDSYVINWACSKLNLTIL